MRPTAILATLALATTALVAAPAQAASGTLNIGWDAAAGEFVITASAGISAFAPEEELVISGSDGLLIASIVDGTHTFTYGTSCTSLGDGEASRASCVTPRTVPQMKVRVDMRAATGATTTAIDSSIGTAKPLSLTFYGGSGPDYVQGGIGNDEIYGGAGDDDLFGGPGDDKVGGDEGSDDVWGEEGDDSVGGGPGDDRVSGDEGADRITGGSGVDSLDSEDGMPDAYVNCDNAPGLGAIAFDRGLDIPRDCPIILTPTQPRDVTADAGGKFIAVSWAPPDFNGNDPDFVYDVRYRRSTGNWQPSYDAAGSETSLAIGDLTPGLYYVSMRARNSAGSSLWTADAPVVIGNDVVAPPFNVQSVYRSRETAYVTWFAPDNPGGVKYELALRVRAKKNQAWGAWTTLPDKTSGTFLMVGDDLAIVHGRVYQFRVRTVDKNKKTSSWVETPWRVASPLAPLKDGTLTLTASNVVAGVNLSGLAWRYNVESRALLAARYTAIGARSAWITMNPSTPTTVTAKLPKDTIDKDFRQCFVQVGYRWPDQPSTGDDWVWSNQLATACPK